MNGILVSIIVGACTGVGALPFLFIDNISVELKNGFLGFAAGIMVFASSFSLIQPAIEKGSLISVTGGIIAGAVLLTAIEYLVPHTHSTNFKESKSLNKVFLLAIAVAIHNIPEGFAIGVGYGTGSATGLSLALAIGIQNIPEGIVVAAPMVEAGYKKSKIIMFSFLTGIGEPIAATIGILTASFIRRLLPFVLSMAAGAMFFVVCHELIPESHCDKNCMIPTYGFLLGLILMLIFKTVIK